MGLKIPLLFSVFLLLGAAATASSPPGNPDPGPRSSEEASFLLKEGSEALARKDHGQAIRSLSRFVGRYPTHSGLKQAYLDLIGVLLLENRTEDAARHVSDCLHQPWDPSDLNRVRAFGAEARLKLQEYLPARLLADELLKANPTAKQTALARSVRFQSLLEEKQLQEAEEELDRLEEHLKKEPIPSYGELLPEFRMTFALRQCTLTHLIKGETFSEEQLLDYFGQKNLCFKSALSESRKVRNTSTHKEWCESFTGLNHEIEKMRIDSFLKEKIRKDLKSTFEFSKGIHVELEKCYRPYRPKKSNRSRRFRKKT